jgi:glycosyltransferase involved in cell wall biosynthesis
MKLTICILSHNRPVLFNRAIESVLSASRDFDIEILVNNDTQDITEVQSSSVEISYTYLKSEDLSELYEYLFNAANGEFIYYLEDDDYINPQMFSHLDFNYDINYILYTSVPHISEGGAAIALERQHMNKHLISEHSYSEFISTYDNTYFQLSQICFRKDILEKFPTGNDISNDYRLFQRFNIDSSIKYINRQLWTQTTDGGDNISFDDLNVDQRFS